MNYKIMISSLITFFILIGCSLGMENKEISFYPVLTPSKFNLTESEKLTPTTIPTVLPQEISTLSILKDQSQITDGRLELSINLETVSCYKSGDKIPILFFYKNLTDEPLIIVDYNVIDTHLIYQTKAQLFPILTNANQEPVYTSYDSMILEIYNRNLPTEYQITPYDTFEIKIDYIFPTEILSYGQSQNTPTGRYFLKYVYIGYANDNTWAGKITSNQVEICITE